MKSIGKRLVAAFLTATLLLSCFVIVQADDTSAAQAVIDSIQNLTITTKTFYDCDSAASNVVANINSGSYDVAVETENKTQGAGSIKVSAKKDLTNNPFSVGLRADAITLNDYDTMSFDMYIAEGVTVSEDTYGYVYYADKHVNNQDERVWRYDIKTQALEAKAGQWNTFTVPVSDANFAGIVQISIRLAITTAKDGYVLLDNVTFTKVTEITYAHKTTVEEIAAAYDALTDDQKQLVTNYAELEKAQEAIAAIEKKVNDVSQMIEALPEVSDVTLEDQESVEAAIDAYDALTDEEKVLISQDNVTKLEDLKVALADILETLITKVEEAIAALPPLEEITLSSDEMIADALNQYNELADWLKPSVENYAVLQAAVQQLELLKAQEDAIARQITQAIKDITVDATIYNDCDKTQDGGSTVVANLNSGGTAVTLESQNTVQGTGSIKIQKQSDRTDYPEHIIGLRTGNFDVSPYSQVCFDLYISNGFSIDSSSSWAYVLLHDGNANGPEQKQIAKLDMKTLVGNAKAGQWNRIIVPLTALSSETLVQQVTIRIGNNFLKGDNDQYVLIDNLCFANAKALTYADKKTISDLQDQYDSLSDRAKALVSNIKTLNEYADKIATIDEAMEKFNAIVATFPTDVTNTDVTATDIDPVLEALALYEVMDDVAKELCKDSYKALSLMAQKVDALLESFAQKVEDMITALPAADQLTLEDEAAVLDAWNAFNALHEEAQKKVENKEALEAAKAKIDALKESQSQSQPEPQPQPEPQQDLGDVNNDKKADAKDALIVLKIAVDKYQPTDAEKIASDVNKDEKIDAKDALEILKKSVGKPACF